MSKDFFSQKESDVFIKYSIMTSIYQLNIADRSAGNIQSRAEKSLLRHAQSENPVKECDDEEIKTLMRVCEAVFAAVRSKKQHLR